MAEIIQIKDGNTDVYPKANGDWRSLVLNTSATDTDTTYNTYDGRKFSDCKTLIFQLGATGSTSDMKTIRATRIIPRTIWENGSKVMLYARHGSNNENYSGVTITYSSDTQVKAVRGGDKGLYGFTIYGQII